MILVNNPGSWAHIYDPLQHAPWHGLTPTDLVFPFFLFAVGNALAFVMPRMQENGDAYFWKKITKRALLIFGIGLFLSWWPFVKWDGNLLVFKEWAYQDSAGNWQGIRILGVLPRIALCYFFAAILLYYLPIQKAFYISLLILVAYWILSFALGDYSMTGWFGNEVDRAILGEAHMYKGERVAGKPFPFDPEGIMSTLPAIVQVVFGYLAGHLVKTKGKTYEMLSLLFVSSVALLATGFIWDTVFPINKKIWTSSYVIYTSGLAMLTIATLIYFIEFREKRLSLFRFFDVFGKNALFVFALSAFLPRGLALIRLENGVNPWNWLYKKFFIHTPGAPENGSLLYAITIIIFFWAICYWMDRKKIYVKV